MGLITDYTKWEDISEYCLLEQVGGINNFYSLSPDANLIIKKELMKTNGFNLAIWHFKYVEESIGLIGLQFLTNDDIFINSGIDVTNNNIDNHPQYDDYKMITDLFQIQVNSKFNSVKWDSESNYLDTYQTNISHDKNVTVSNTNNNFEREVKNVKLSLNATIRNNFIQGNTNNFLYIAAIDPKRFDQNGDQIVSNYYRIVKKKYKSAYVRDYIISTKQNQNFIYNLFTKNINTESINEYCCKEPTDPECSSAYFNNKTLYGNLFYFTYNSTNKNNIIKSGYLSEPINNVKTIFNDLPASANEGIINGFIQFPTSELYSIKVEFTNPIDLTIGKTKIVEMNSNSPMIFTINSDSNLKYDISLLVTNANIDNLKVNISYKKNNMLNYINIPSEWLSANYYYDIIKDYNEYLTQACSNNWDNSNCYNTIKNNNYLLDQLSNSIIDKCKTDSKSPACIELYNDHSQNFDIQKAFCVQDLNYINSLTCNKLAKANKKYFKKEQINYCTNDKKIWNDSTCQDYIMDASSWYPNDKEFYDAYCLLNKHFKDDYKTCSNYYSTDIGIPKGNEFVNTIVKECTSDKNLFKTCITGNDEEVIMPEYLNTELLKSKRLFCSQNNNFSNPDCAEFIKENPEILDEILIKQCTTYPTEIEPCKTLLNPNYPKLKLVQEFNKHVLTSHCIDKNGMYTDTVECENRNTITNPNSSVLNDATTKYCKEGDNISSQYCKNKMEENIFNLLSKEVPSKSGFTNPNQYSNEYNIFLLFLFIVILSILFYKFTCNKYKKINYDLDLLLLGQNIKFE
jgi:hypothetical protein